MLKQTEIDFNVHQYESKAESQIILDNNRPHFSRQCRVLFDALMAGKVLTSEISFLEYNIVDFRRRICDLKEIGVLISSRLKQNSRSKEWFLDKDQKEYNSKFNYSDIENNTYKLK
jgi:hypothetical protein